MDDRVRSLQLYRLARLVDRIASVITMGAQMIQENTTCHFVSSRSPRCYLDVLFADRPVLARGLHFLNRLFGLGTAGRAFEPGESPSQGNGCQSLLCSNRESCRYIQSMKKGLEPAFVLLVATIESPERRV